MMVQLSLTALCICPEELMNPYFSLIILSTPSWNPDTIVSGFGLIIVSAIVLLIVPFGAFRKLLRFAPFPVPIRYPLSSTPSSVTKGKVTWKTASWDERDPEKLNWMKIPRSNPVKITNLAEKLWGSLYDPFPIIAS